MASYRWLRDQLHGRRWLDVEEYNSDVLQVRCGDQTYLIYAAERRDYLVTVDTIQKAEELGANTVVYGSSWGYASTEAVEYGKQHDILVLDYAALFRRLEHP